MKRVLFLVVSLVIFAPAQAANDSPSLQDIILVSKMTGVCGVMQQMAAFQQATKMPGGNEFIARFWRTEFARLAKSQETFLKECEGSISAYGQLLKLSEETGK